MSLMICPECAHEVSSTAAACPNCGHPFVRPTVQPRVIINELPPEKEGFPTWAFIPLGLLGLVLVFVVFLFMRNGDDEAQRNINVRVASQPPSGSRETTVRPDAPPNQIVVPSTSQPGQIVAPPPSSQTTVTTLPSTTTTVVAPDKGTVSLEAKVLGRTGGAQPVPKEVFYLLDKDLDSILNDADIEDESGQGLVNAFGLSIMFPDRYGDVRKKALAAIGKHSKYKVTTDASGKAQMKDVKPDNYYLFAITKTANGFAIWKNSVTIQPGQNALVLEPVSPTEITQE
ncbi:MAG: hypothetical protein LH472_08550 [Pyrinomonadaceae bacterium]|nr:hypothetical protein [Pyrinomonadaceae bacterium]